MSIQYPGKLALAPTFIHSATNVFHLLLESKLPAHAEINGFNKLSTVAALDQPGCVSKLLAASARASARARSICGAVEASNWRVLQLLINHHIDIEWIDDALAALRVVSQIPRSHADKFNAVTLKRLENQIMVGKGSLLCPTLGLSFEDGIGILYRILLKFQA
jgi:hypothetical protein